MIHVHFCSYRMHKEQRMLFDTVDDPIIFSGFKNIQKVVSRSSSINSMIDIYLLFNDRRFRDRPKHPTFSIQNTGSPGDVTSDVPKPSLERRFQHCRRALRTRLRRWILFWGGEVEDVNQPTFDPARAACSFVEKRFCHIFLLGSKSVPSLKLNLPTVDGCIKLCK